MEMDINAEMFRKDVYPHYGTYRRESQDYGNEPRNWALLIISAIMLMMALCMCSSCKSGYQVEYDKSVIRNTYEHRIDSMNQQMDSLRHAIVERDSVVSHSEQKDSVWQWRWQSDTLMVNDSTVVKYLADGSTWTDHWRYTTRVIKVQEKSGMMHSDSRYESRIHELEDSLGNYKNWNSMLSNMLTTSNDSIDNSYTKVTEYKCSHPWYISIALWFYRVLSVIGLFFMVVFFVEHWSKIKPILLLAGKCVGL